MKRRVLTALLAFMMLSFTSPACISAAELQNADNTDVQLWYDYFWFDFFPDSTPDNTSVNYAYRPLDDYNYGVNPALDSAYDKINAMVQSILSQIINPEMSDDEKVKAVYDFLLRQYVHKDRNETAIDPKIEYTKYKLTSYDENLGNFDNEMSMLFSFYSGGSGHTYYKAYELLYDGEGGCSNFSQLFYLMLHKLGIQTLVTDGEYINRDGTRLYHVWNIVYIDGTWHYYDVDVEGSVYRRSKSLSYYLYKKDKEYWKTYHNWNIDYVDKQLQALSEKLNTIRADY